ncbi:hypothetical protein UYSO10_0916 [Kosakonia radicincitans]|uniref:fimbrial protein n=1 Tax=Kosakonia TaxID=1330547 RepID=UPI00118283D0|nr:MULTISPECIES: type 1 fimbrial protein [Kosakonia]UDJ82057.1 type 1 fimbrial protein [Kosakonia oryzae]VVT46458.1 hypothetical protein UYSO10_0916 [Kosakonia radicincitans]
MKQFGPNCFISAGKTSGNAGLLSAGSELPAQGSRGDRCAFHDHETLIYLKENSMKKIIALSALMAALASANAMAADANLTFTGSVTSSTCTMNASDATKTLVIPDISSAALVARGVNGYQTQQANTTVSFTSCPASVSQIKVASVTSTGTVQTDKTMVKPASGTANGVWTSLVLGGPTGYVAADGSVLSYGTSVTSGGASVYVGVGVVAASTRASVAAPTAGTYSNSYTLTFSWS